MARLPTGVVSLIKAESVNNDIVKKGVLLEVRGIVLYITVPSILIGLLCIGGGIFSAYYSTSQRADNQLVSGVITDASGAAGFRYTDASGKEIDARSSTSISPSPYHVGQEVKAYVNPAKPDLVTIDSFAETWGISLFLIIFGAFFTIIPAIILKVFWSVSSLAEQAMENGTMTIIDTTKADTTLPTASKDGEPGQQSKNPISWS